MPYSEFLADPWMFSQPEILVDPKLARFVDARIAVTKESDPVEALPVPILGIKSRDGTVSVPKEAMLDKEGALVP